jgi:GDA1/CD39 (nucleoside phosphatase) family
MYEVMAIVAFVIGIVVVLSLALTLIMLAVSGKSPARANGPARGTRFAGPAAGAATARALITPAIATILGGGLIWLGLHYGFEFHERLIALASRTVAEKPRALPGDPKQSSACNTVEARYGLIIDAGSSGSRIYIYCWKLLANGTPWVAAASAQVGKPGKDKVEKGLSQFPSADEAKESLEPLVTYARGQIGDDREILKQTPLYLMATGGMRLKQKSNPEQSKETMRLVRDYLRETFDAYADIISGDDEAFYGWIAVNYLTGFLKERKGESSSTMGILELGGASTQIAYALSDLPSQGLAALRPLPWGETTYQVYRHSLDELGQDKAFENINKKIEDEKGVNPCHPKGYVIPEIEGNYGDCKKAIERILPLQKIAESEPLMNQRRPPQGVFLAYAGYYHTYSTFIKVLNDFPFAELEVAGVSYCESNRKALESHPDYDVRYWPKYCFTAAYIAAVLQTVFGFPQNTQQIISTNTLHGSDISWTLGAMIAKRVDAKLP